MDLHNGLERKQGNKNSHKVATLATSQSSQKYTLLDWTSFLPVTLKVQTTTSKIGK